MGVQKTHRVLKSHEIAAFCPYILDFEKKSNGTPPLKGGVTDRHIVNLHYVLIYAIRLAEKAEHLYPAF